MRKEAIFCDLCERHIPDSAHGASFGLISGKVLLRKLEFTTANDISICVECQPQLLRKLHDGLPDWDKKL